MAKPKRPRDPNQRAKSIVDIATGESTDADPNEGKDPAAVALGRKGGAARANRHSCTVSMPILLALNLNRPQEG